ncbi:hypothetical protein MRX96_003146 [Rhipicephalus microplus]
MVDGLTGRQCHFHAVMDSTTPAAESRLSFRPPGGPNLGTLSPVSDFQSFLAELQQFHRSARKTHIAVNASTADAVQGRRRVTSTEIKPATGKDIADAEVAVTRHRRRVTATNTRCLSDEDCVKLKGSVAFGQNLFGKKTTTRKTSELQDDASGNTTQTRGKKRRCEVGPANDLGIHDETPQAKNPRLEVKEFEATEPVHPCKVSATMQVDVFRNKKNKNSGIRDTMVPWSSSKMCEWRTRRRCWSRVDLLHMSVCR